MKYFLIVEIDSADGAAHVKDWLWTTIVQAWVRSFGTGAKLRIVKAISIEGEVTNIDVQQEK